jgi:hypothetical protein
LLLSKPLVSLLEDKKVTSLDGLKSELMKIDRDHKVIIEINGPHHYLQHAKEDSSVDMVLDGVS